MGISPRSPSPRIFCVQWTHLRSPGLSRILRHPQFWTSWPVLLIDFFNFFIEFILVFSFIISEGLTRPTPHAHTSTLPPAASRRHFRRAVAPIHPYHRFMSDPAYHFECRCIICYHTLSSSWRIIFHLLGIAHPESQNMPPHSHKHKWLSSLGARRCVACSCTVNQPTLFQQC
jgi:hypothetical protein